MSPIESKFKLDFNKLPEQSHENKEFLKHQMSSDREISKLDLTSALPAQQNT